jgi:hypothetical protein
MHVNVSHFASSPSLGACEPSIPSRNDDAVPFQKIRWGHRQIPLSHGRHHLGHAIPWPGAHSLPVESNEERIVLKALANRPQCVALVSQPFTVWYPWRGRMRRYTPDFLAIFASVPVDLQQRGAAQCTVIEVRPERRIRIGIDTWEARRQAVWAATRMPLLLLWGAIAQEDVA